MRDRTVSGPHFLEEAKLKHDISERVAERFNRASSERSQHVLLSLGLSVSILRRERLAVLIEAASAEWQRRVDGL